MTELLGVKLQVFHDLLSAGLHKLLEFRLTGLDALNVLFLVFFKVRDSVLEEFLLARLEFLNAVLVDVVTHVEHSLSGKHAAVDLKLCQVTVNGLQQCIEWVDVGRIDITFAIFRNKVIHRNLIDIVCFRLLGEIERNQSSNKYTHAHSSDEHGLIFARLSDFLLSEGRRRNKVECKSSLGLSHLKIFF